MLPELRVVSICLLLFNGSIVRAQAPEIEELIEQLEAAQAGLLELETQYDRNNPRLVEALEQLADQFLALDQFDAAHQALDRAMQITRLDEGLFTPSQIPLIQKKINNYVNRGDWESARMQSEHLLWLYQSKIPVNENLVYQFLALTDVSLRGVVEDEPLQQTYHFRQAMESNRLALLVARNVWGEQDMRVVPIIYRMLKQHYLQTIAINRGGETGYTLREIVPGTRWVYDRETMRRTHYHVGLELLQLMRDVYSEAATADAEAIAMVDLYVADWQVLYTRKDQALSSYEKAYQGLLQAGVERETLAAFFAVPAVLPITEFHPTIASAQAAKAMAPTVPAADSVPDVALALQFNEWSQAFPNVQAPVRLQSPAQPDSDFALFSFSLTGLNEVSRWIAGSYRSAIGAVDKAELLELQLDTPDAEDGMINKLHRLRFRPPLHEGAPASASGMLMYVVAK